MIGREKLIELVHNARMNALWHNSQKPSEYITDMLISDGVTVRERGRWEQVQRWATKAKYRCSVCGREIMSAVTVNIEKYPFCHCGADMRGEEDGNET